MKNIFIIFSAFNVLILVQSEDYLNLTYSDCISDVVSTDCITNEIIFFKGGEETIFKLTAEGANETYNNALFDNSATTVIYFHGYIASPYDVFTEQIKEAYATIESTTNFFIVNAAEDYSGLYTHAVYEMPCVCGIVAEYLGALYDLGVSEDNIHLMGHSLGAQTVHCLAQKFISRTEVQVNRATGLDPAGPCFDPDTENQLNENDAKLVDIIHTSSGTYGTSTRLGQANFIPYGGEIQPGCDVLTPCSHLRSLTLYKESVLSTDCIYTQVSSNDDFVTNSLTNSNSLTNVELLGYGWGGTSGLYDAYTNLIYPYCAGISGLN